MNLYDGICRLYFWKYGTVFCICILVFKKEDGDDPEEWDDPEGPGNALCILLPGPRSHPEVRFNEAQAMRVLFLRPHLATSPGGRIRSGSEGVSGSVGG